MFFLLFLAILAIEAFAKRYVKTRPKLQSTIAYKFCTNFAVIDKALRVCQHTCLWLIGYFSHQPTELFVHQQHLPFDASISRIYLEIIIPLRRTLKFVKAQNLFQNIGKIQKDEFLVDFRERENIGVFFEKLLIYGSYFTLVALYIADTFRLFYDLDILGTEESSNFMRDVIKNTWMIFNIQHFLLGAIKLGRMLKGKSLKEKFKNTTEIMILLDLIYCLTELYVNIVYRYPVTAQEKMICGGLLVITGSYKLGRMVMT